MIPVSHYAIKLLVYIDLLIFKYFDVNFVSVSVISYPSVIIF